MIARNPAYPRYHSAMAPGLRKEEGRYAKCVGVLQPVIFVDPTVSGLNGEEALIAHEAAHAIERHGLKANLSLGLGVFFASIAVVASFIHLWASGLAWLSLFLWLLNHVIFLRQCEIDADRYALEGTDPNTFVAFLHLHPHPKGRWGRWLYGSSREARILRVLPKS